MDQSGRTEAKRKAKQNQPAKQMMGRIDKLMEENNGNWHRSSSVHQRAEGLRLRNEVLISTSLAPTLIINSALKPTPRMLHMLSHVQAQGVLPPWTMAVGRSWVTVPL